MQIDGIERELGEYTGQNGGDTQLGMEHTGAEASGHAGQHGHQQRRPGGPAGQNQHDGAGTAGGKGTINRQVRHVQQTEGNIYAKGHQTPDQSLRNAARHVFEQLQYTEG